nr:reverse transcriptase domain-containing protein [Tanacetum cinerariifolium]
MRFRQRFDESFYEARERFNDLLRACPHHGFSELHQLDTFYNALNVNDQDSLNSAAGGNFLDKMPRECLKIIESKSKVRQSRAKAVVAEIGTSSSTPAISSDVAELKDMVKALLLDKKNQSPAPTPSSTPAPVKTVEPNCVTCGGAHSYQNCPATHENAYRDNIQEYVSQAAAANYNQGNIGFRPQMVANQIQPPSFPPYQNNQNNFNRGNNFNQNRGENFNQSNFNPSSFNQGQLHRPQVNQAPVYQASIPQLQRVFQTDFESYVKANDAILRNMQSQCQSTQNQCQNIQNQYQNLQIQMADLTDMISKFVSANTASSSGSGTLPGNIITNPKEELKGITTRSGVAYRGPKTHSPSKQGTKVTKDQVQTPTSQNTAPVQPSVIQSESLASVFEPVVAQVSAPMPNLKPSIPYPSRRDNEKRRDQANEQIKKFYEIFKEISFEISFTDALILMPKFASTLKALIGNKKKLSEMSRTTMNEHCSAVILNKLPRKLGDPGKFLIPCEFPGMDECLALADLGASINLMPLSVWEGLSLPELTPTCMTLELADRLVSKPIDPRVPLILGWCFLKTSRALIDVHKGELTLRIRNEAITYNLDQTVRYSANYNQMTANKIDVIESACEEYSPEEADTFLGLEDDPDSPKINPFYYDPKGDILLLEAILNSKPSHPLPNQEQNLPSFKEELKAYEAQTVKSSVDEPLEVELKDLPHHIEYTFLEGDNKLPIIIAKELGSEEKSALIKVLKSHKRAIAWKLSDIQGINPEFCTHKILMEEDYKLAVQHQRRVNPKIHDVIKKEVEKFLDAGLIYPISDSTLYGFSGYFQIPIDPRDQEKTTFTWPYGTFAYRRMPFGLCNAPGTFQRCMLAIFHDMVEKTMEVFMDDFSVFGNSFENYLSSLDKMLQWCEDTNLSLNWEKSHFMVKEGIVLGHKISKNEIEVDRAKVDVIAKLPHPTTVKDCIKAFQTLKKKLTEAPILIAPNWDLPFELMCDASDFAIGAFMGQRHEKHFKPIHYASKTMNDAETNYTTTEKEMLAVVEIARWVLLLQEFDFKVLDTKGAENLADDHLSRLENPYENMLDPKEINETFPLETLSMVTFRGDSSAPCVCTARKLSTFSKFTTMDPRGDIMVQTSLPKRSLMSVSSGPPFTKMPMSLLNIVTHANDKGEFHNGMRCLRILSKIVKSLTFRALILWARSRLHEGINIFSWLSITCQNGLKRKRSPPTTPVLFANSLNLSSPDLVHLELS